VSEVGIAILGYGDVGRKHLYAFRNIRFHFPELSIVPIVRVVYGRRLESVKAFAEKYGIPRYSINMDEAIRSDDISVVDVALPNYLHHVATFKAIDNGKHVICEKPLAITAELAWEMYQRAKDSGVLHGVVYNYRWLPAIQLARKLIEIGVIGKVHHFRGMYLEDYGADPSKPLSWRYRKAEAGSGTLGDNATHVIDLARFLVGEIVEVCAKGATYICERPLPEDPSKKGRVDTDDEFVSIVMFRNGAIGTIEASRIAHGRRNWLEIEVRGTKGYIVWNLNRLNELELFIEDDIQSNGPRRILVTDAKHPYIERFWPPNAPIGLVDGFTIAFAEYFKAMEEKREYIPNFLDGAINCSVIDAMLKSWQEGKCIEVRYS